MIEDKFKKFLDGLQELKESGEPFNILNRFKALASDISTTHAFGKSHGALDKKAGIERKSLSWISSSFCRTICIEQPANPSRSGFQ
jgi:hypothetical protein